MNKRQMLPVGDASFESIRKNNKLYVDKTRHIFRMVDEGNYYFFARPRRFGKSLTVSTLRRLFEGDRELFNGLWIEKNTDWDWKPHPVILLDFNQISHDTPENLTISLGWTLQKIAEAYGIVSDAPLLKDQFKELILSLHQKTGAPVVTLIDEYDKPLIDHLGKGDAALDIAKANRDILKYFLGVLKGGDVAPVVRFVFITGVSKFSRVSLFSELNNLEDISMSPRYADLTGYTQAEVESCLKPYIDELAKTLGVSYDDAVYELERYYNGYRFTGKEIRVYNPFSMLLVLKNQEFRNYWFETGTPGFLVYLLKERNYPVAKIENLKLDEQIFSVYDLDRLQIEALMFQTGYITIKDVKDGIYEFHYPNREVKISFLKSLMYAHIPGNGHDLSLFLQLSAYLRNEEIDAFIDTVKAIFKSIPYTIETKRDEAYFHTAFFLIVSASGTGAQSEVLTCDGRIDMVVEYPDKIYIIEFKCDQSAESAIQQIRDKGYDEKFKPEGKKIILMGINFDSEKRNVSEFIIA